MGDDPLVLQEAEPKGSAKTKLIVGAIVLAGLGFGYLIGAAVIPRWWAQKIGDIIDGRLFFGGFMGVVIGALCTFLPLVSLRIAWRFRKGAKRALTMVVVAAILAFPNLALLGIVTGSGNAAHAGERILDVDGPGFRGGSLVGVVIGALMFFGLGGLMWSRRRNKRQAHDLKGDAKARKAAEKAEEKAAKKAAND